MSGQRPTDRAVVLAKRIEQAAIQSPLPPGRLVTLEIPLTEWKALAYEEEHKLLCYAAALRVEVRFSEGHGRPIAVTRLAELGELVRAIQAAHAMLTVATAEGDWGVVMRVRDQLGQLASTQVP